MTRPYRIPEPGFIVKCRECNGKEQRSGHQQSSAESVEPAEKLSGWPLAGSGIEGIKILS